VLTCTDKREVGTSTETVEDKISDLAGVNLRKRRDIHLVSEHCGACTNEQRRR
jgi:hypothetical protein